ncbi:MAG: DUF881 domain-containing protein [Nocardioides sp.]|nr:DUF881 domain-containing protein [Nocardioidaceae bacterium]MCB8955640.1 DUF881 domain-containing protein [Nocardioides sp.]
MGIEMEETLSRELHEVADRLAVPPMPSLPSHASNGGQPSRRAWEPPLVAAATIVVLAVVGLLALQEGGHDPQPAPPPGPAASQAPPSRADDPEGQRHQRRIERLQDPAGQVPRTGPGVTVTLSDAPEEVISSTTHDLNFLVVHQQDIRSVVNAMWKAGAIAVTVQGQRVVSTAEITCEGNAVILQGMPYSQPYRVSAVGDQDSLLAAIDSDPDLKVYRQQAADPEISIGWDLQLEPSITAPAYEGQLDLNDGEPRRG